MHKQYIVSEAGTTKRKTFYDYIMANYDLTIGYPHEEKRFVNNKFPFVVDLKRKEFWVCESITCCAAAKSNHAIYTIDEFLKLTNK